MAHCGSPNVTSFFFTSPLPSFGHSRMRHPALAPDKRDPMPCCVHFPIPNWEKNEQGNGVIAQSGACSAVSCPRYGPSSRCWYGRRILCTLFCDEMLRFARLFPGRFWRSPPPPRHPRVFRGGCARLVNSTFGLERGKIPGYLLVGGRSVCGGSAELHPASAGSWHRWSRRLINPVHRSCIVLYSTKHHGIVSISSVAASCYCVAVLFRGGRVNRRLLN
jgi:hypothetical protein